MPAFKGHNNCTNVLGRLTKFTIFMLVFMNCQECESTPLGKNFESLDEMLMLNEPQRMQTFGGRQWKKTYQHPLFQRYHGAGTDFAARTYGFPSNAHWDVQKYPLMEVKYFVCSILPLL